MNDLRRAMLSGTVLAVPLIAAALSFVFVDCNVYFKSNSAVVTPADLEKLKNVACHTNAKADGAVLIGGYASSFEREPEILALGRAQAVKEALLREGVSEVRIIVETHGATLPVASDNDAEGRARNRRVELTAGKASTGSNCGPVSWGRPIATDFETPLIRPNHSLQRTASGGR